MSAPAATPLQAVQCFGRKKTAVAVAYCKKGKGILKLNGSPIEMIQPELLRYKVFEPVLLLGAHRFAQVDIRIRCKGGGYTSQIYAIRQVCPLRTHRFPRPARAAHRARMPRPRAPHMRAHAVTLVPRGSPACLAWRALQAIAKSLVAYYQKFVDEASKKEIRDILVSFDRTLLVADPRRCEPKKFGGRGARARFQKSYR